MRTSTRLHAERKGFALAIAIVAIVIIGVLVAGAFFTSTQDMRVGANSMVQQRAFAIAERGLNSSVASFDSLDLDTLANGETQAIGPITVGTGRDAGTWLIRATRLNDRTYWLLSEGTADAGRPTATTRMTNMVVRLRGFQLATLAAFTARSMMDIGGGVEINGQGPRPTGWNVCLLTVDPDAPGVIAPTGVTIDEDTASNVIGDPTGVIRDPLAADTTSYVDFGDHDLASLISIADRPSASGVISPLPSVTGSTCNMADPNNWGDHTRTSTCQNFFPVVYAPGNLQLTNGRGQGILIVNGDLELLGGFNYAGVVIIGGELRASGSNNIWGTVLARGRSGRSGYLRGDLEIRYSQCVIREATRSVARAMPVTQRAWADLF